MANREFSREPVREVLQTPDGLKASLNINGAYIESLVAPDGSNLLFPQQYVDGKNRGGIPICAPVFGPSKQLGLPQHGYARDMTWEHDSAVVNGDDSRLFLSLNGYGDMLDYSSDQYSDLVMNSRFELLSDNSAYTLNMGLTLINNGGDPIIAAPGFHPYFPVSLDEDQPFKITGTNDLLEEISQEELKNAKQLPHTDNVLSFSVDGYSVWLASTNLRTPVVWSGNPDKFVCVEPTSSGFLKSAPDGSIDSQQQHDSSIMPGQSKDYSMTITWAPRTGIDQTQ